MAISTTTSTTPPPPGAWDRLRLNAVEVTYDLERDTTEIRVANTFFMLDDYSEIKRRLMQGLMSRREDRRSVVPLSMLSDTSDSGSGTKDTTTTTSAGTSTTTSSGTTTTMAGQATTTTAGTMTTTENTTTTTDPTTTTTESAATTTEPPTTTTAQTTTTTAGTTTTTAATTTTTDAATTTTQGTTTTTDSATTTTSATCPSDPSGCPSTVYADVGSSCQYTGDCTGTYQWNYDSDDSGYRWVADSSNPCDATTITCSSGLWDVSAPAASMAICGYEMAASGDGDCPTGTFSRYEQSCYSGTCNSELTIYS